MEHTCTMCEGEITHEPNCPANQAGLINTVTSVVTLPAPPTARIVSMRAVVNTTPSVMRTAHITNGKTYAQTELGMTVWGRMLDVCEMVDFLCNPFQFLKEDDEYAQF